LPDAEERPGFGLEPGCHDGLDCQDLALLDRMGRLPDSHDLDHSGRNQEREAVFEVKTAEQVAGEERAIDVLHAVRPPAPGLVERKEAFVALAEQGRRYDLLEAGTDVKREPLIRIGGGAHW